MGSGDGERVGREGLEISVGGASETTGLPFAGNLEHAHVLVLEEVGTTQVPLDQLLAPDLEVRYARDAEEARARLRAEGPELLLLDVPLTSVEDVADLSRLFSDARREQVPVIVVSTANEDLAAACLDQGAADYLPRSARARELLARIHRTVRDGRERRALQALAQTDALTGLANFRALAERVEAEFHRAVRYGHPVSVVTIDLDHLKDINDRFGHEAGNRAILALAKHLGANLRESDFAARFGGDEFVVILPHQQPLEAGVFADRLRRTLQPIELPGGELLPISVSVGIAGHSREASRASASELLEASDTALNQAKRRGRGRVVVLEEEAAEPPRHA
ncbi:MAG: GGDEF domain-containing response regulator [Myxococcota bacterium]